MMKESNLFKIKRECNTCSSCGYDLNPKGVKECYYCGTILSLQDIQNPVQRVLELLNQHGYNATCDMPQNQEPCIRTIKPLDLRKNHVLAGGIYRVGRMLFVGFSNEDHTEFWITTPKNCLSESSSHYEN